MRILPSLNCNVVASSVKGIIYSNIFIHGPVSTMENYPREPTPNFFYPDVWAGVSETYPLWHTTKTIIPLTDVVHNAHSLTVQRGQNAHYVHYVPSL